MKRTLRILYIDDDPDTRFLMRELLAESQQPDHETRIEWRDAAGVEEAVERWSGAKLDAIFLDNRLAGCEGVNRITHLRAVWECPVWLVTGAPDDRLRDRAERSGAQGLLTKDLLLGRDAAPYSAILSVVRGEAACQTTR